MIESAPHGHRENHAERGEGDETDKAKASDGSLGISLDATLAERPQHWLAPVERRNRQEVNYSHDKRCGEEQAKKVSCVRPLPEIPCLTAWCECYQGDDVVAAPRIRQSHREMVRRILDEIGQRC